MDKPEHQPADDDGRSVLGPLFAAPGHTRSASTPIVPAPIVPAPIVPALTDDEDVHRAEAQFEPLHEVGALPWDAVLRARLARRVPREMSKWFILAAVLMGNFAGGIVFTLLSVSREAIAKDLRAQPSLVLWAFTAPSLVAAIVAPSFGRLGDLFGHKRMLMYGLIGGTLTSLLVAVSPNVQALIFFRGLSAVAGASLGPASLALIFRVFDRDDRVKAMGYWSLVNAGSPVLGVLIGGPIAKRFGWQTMFLGQVPFYLLALVVGYVVLPETTKRTVRRFDWWGAILLGVTTFCVLLSVNRGPKWGWTDPKIVGGFLLAPIVLAAFVWVERTVSEPLLPLHLLRIRNVVAGIGAQTFSQFAYLGAGLFLVNDLLLDKKRFAFDIDRAGIYTISRPICFALVAPLSGLLAIRRGERFTATLGMACIFFSMVGFAIMRPGSTLIGLVTITGLAGLGQGIASPSLTSSVANAVPESVLGVIGASQQLLTQMGGVIGTQVMTTMVGGDGVRTDAAYHRAFIVAAVLALVAVFCARGLTNANRTHP